MGTLIVAAAIWIGLHIGVSGTKIRDAAATRLGENGFRGAFALVSVASLLFLILAYNQATTSLLWLTPDWVRWLLVLVMLPAAVFFLGSLLNPNPTAVAGEKALATEPRGITRVTRHPMLWSFAIWAAVHIVGNGDSASVIFFGTFMVTALAGMPSIDAKLARRDPEHWNRIAAATSIIPGGAIRAGRNRLVPAEIGWPVWLGGALLWAALLLGHQYVIGVSPLPGG